MNKNSILNVKDASLYCTYRGLPRSPKSIRRWCAGGDIDAEKRPNGRTEQWFIKRESLEIKIKEELEFLKQLEHSLSQPENATRHTADVSAFDRVRADVSGHKRSQADTSERERTHPDAQNQPQIRDLEDQILLLKNDIKWRDQLLKDQKNINIVLMDEVKGQSRYIGHLETNVLRLGGSTDQAFLAAPVPKSGVSEDVESEVRITTSGIVPNE